MEDLTMAIGRNDPCPCGSGKKYKKCCMQADARGGRNGSRARPTQAGPPPDRQPTIKEYLDLGNRLAEQDRPKAAMMAWGEALKLDRNYLPALNNMGRMLVIQDRPDEALEYLERAAELDTAGAEVARRLSTAQEMVGDLEAAKANAEEALRRNPKDVPALLMLANLLKADLPEQHREAMESLLEHSSSLDDRQRRKLHFGLLNVYRGMKDYEQVARHSRRANTIDKATRLRQGTEFNVEYFQAMTEGQLRHYTPEYMEKVRPFGSDSRRPIFVIGLPRSGTTLTERVLGKHRNVYPAGELPDLNKAFNALPNIVRRNVPPADCLPILAKQGRPVTQMAEYYLKRLDVYDSEHPHVIDKACNGLFIGLIFTMFPQARVVHVQRDLRDTAVSCWMQQFQRVSWACDVEWMATHFRGHERLMERWYELFSDRILPVRYADVVEDLEGQARRMADFFELEWDEGMLKFYEDGGAVRTASVRQVRRPVYKGSLGRWKRYEPYPSDLFEAIADIKPCTGPSESETTPAEAAPA
jgi:tetratricopeptide (TPR) repeat protein